MMVATIILTETTRSLEQLITLSVPGLAEGNAHSTVWFFPDALNVQVCTGTSTGMYNNVHWHGWMKTGKMLPQPEIKLLHWPLYHRGDVYLNMSKFG